MTNLTIDLVQQLFPRLRTVTQVEQLTKGFSRDKKYRVQLEDGNSYILRTAGLDQLDHKQAEFVILQELNRLDVRTSQPIEFGSLQQLGLIYQLLSYIEGEDASDQLPHYSEEEQYEVGLAAGRELKKMHQLPAPASIAPWYPRVIDKHNRYVAAYLSCGITIPGANRALRFIEANERFLKNRPNQFQHDDFHVGNIIVKNKRFAGTIDVNRFDWGDPIHDFYKLALFSREVSVPFCMGQITGYFEEERIPEHFWKLYSIYAAMSIFSAIVWSIRFTPDLVEGMVKRVMTILEDHQYFEQIVPTWYRP